MTHTWKKNKKGFLDSVYEQMSPSGKKRALKYKMPGGKHIYKLSQDDMNSITKRKVQKLRDKKGKNWERFKKKFMGLFD